MRRRWFFIVVLIASTHGAGCGWMNTPYFRTPSIRHPGSAPYQTQAAARFDPYPSDEFSTPITGGRPPGFRSPPAETTRVRQDKPWANWRGYAW